MKKSIILLMIVLAAIAVTGCASNENAIVSIDLNGAVVVGEPVINESDKTITATIEPVDISTITPSIVVSSKAVVGEITLKDGEACKCTVTAEDKTAAEWTITVTVEPGISFKYDDKSLVLKKGIIHSEDSVLNEQYGNGVPIASITNIGTSSPPTYGFCGEKNLDHAASAEPTTDYLYLFFWGNEAGAVPEDSYSLQFGSPVNKTSFSMTGSNDTQKFILTSYGEVGEYITGTFSGKTKKLVDGAETDTLITGGFFKLLRLKDYALQAK